MNFTRLQDTSIKPTEARLRIIAIEEIGENCMTIEQGKKIHQIVRPILQVGGLVALDFFGVQVFTSAFFNFAIGQLLREFTPEFLNEALSIDNLNPIGIETLAAVIDKASRFYAKE